MQLGPSPAFGFDAVPRSPCPPPAAVSSLLCAPGAISILRRQRRGPAAAGRAAAECTSPAPRLRLWAIRISGLLRVCASGGAKLEQWHRALAVMHSVLDRGP